MHVNKYKLSPLSKQKDIIGPEIGGFRKYHLSEHYLISI